jgi:hypothetical protein
LAIWKKCRGRIKSLIYHCWGYLTPWSSYVPLHDCFLPSLSILIGQRLKLGLYGERERSKQIHTNMMSIWDTFLSKHPLGRMTHPASAVCTNSFVSMMADFSSHHFEGSDNHDWQKKPQIGWSFTRFRRMWWTVQIAFAKNWADEDDFRASLVAALLRNFSNAHTNSRPGRELCCSDRWALFRTVLHCLLPWLRYVYNYPEITPTRAIWKGVGMVFG